MHNDGHDLLRPIFTNTGLFGARAAQRHWVYSLKMAGIGNQMHPNGLAIARAILSGSPLVIFHITSAQHAARINIFKSGKNIFRGNTHSQGHHREASAMTHGHHAGMHSLVGSSLQNHIEQRNKRGIAFAGVTLGSQITGLQDLLEKVSLKQTLSQPAAVHGRRLRIFDSLLKPFPAGTLRNVHKLYAHGSAVDTPRFFSARPLGAQFRETSGERAAKWIQVGIEIAPAAEYVKSSLPLQRL